MTGRQRIHELDEYQEITQPSPEQQAQTAETAREAVDPVISLEKNDVQFWLQVAQVVLLFAIYRQLAMEGV